MFGPSGWSDYGRYSYALQYGVRGLARPAQRSPAVRRLMRPGRCSTVVPGACSAVVLLSAPLLR